MLMTPTIGVGTNRDLGLELCEAEYGFIVDDDMVFYDNVEETLNNALKNTLMLTLSFLTLII